MRRLGFCAVFLLLGIASITTGCAGGSSASPSAQVPITSSSIIGVGNAAEAVVSGNGYGAIVDVPATADGGTGTVQVVVGVTPPSGVQAVNAVEHQSLAIGGAITPLVYVSITPSAKVRFSSLPKLTFSLPAGVTPPVNGSAAYVAFYDPAASSTGWVTVLGPGSVNGQTITFAPLNESVTLSAGATYAFALYTSADPTPITSTLSLFRANPKSFVLAANGTPTMNNAQVTITRVDGGVINGGATITGSPASCNTGAFGYMTNGITTPTVTVNLWQNVYPAAGCTFAYMFTDPVSSSFIKVPIQAAAPPVFTVTPTSTVPGFGVTFASTITASLSNNTLPNLAFAWNPPACNKYFAYTPLAATAKNAIPIQVFAQQQSTYAASQPGSDCAAAQLQITETTTNAMVPIAVATAAPPVFTVTPTSLTLTGVGSKYAVTVTASDSDALFSNGGISFGASSGASPSPSATACASNYTSSYTAPSGTGTSGSVLAYETAPLAGTCVLTVKDAFSGQSAQIPITLPTGSVTIGGQ